MAESKSDILEFVTIRKTKELVSMGLAIFANLRVGVLEWKKSGENPGAYIRLSQPYQEETDWFVPMSSIVTRKMEMENVNKCLISDFRI